VERLLRRFGDDVLEADTGDRDTQIERQMSVAPDMKADDVACRAHHLLAGRVHDIEIAPPDHDDQRHAEHG